jgi:AbiU2
MATIENQVDEIEVAILRTDLANVIRTVRNKSVAHDEVVHDGTDWRMWRIEGTVLTYGQLDEYADACTRAVDALARIVLRTAFSFNDLPRISERYADDFIEALVFGLNHQREVQEERRRRNLAEAAALGARPSQNQRERRDDGQSGVGICDRLRTLR